MGENRSTADFLTKKDSKALPKKIFYTKKLLQINRENNRFQRLKKRLLRRSKDEYNKSHLAEIIGNNKSDRNAHQYLDKCIKHEILQEKRVEGTPPNQISFYTINSDQLRKKFYQDPYCQKQLDLFTEIIKKEVPGKTIEKEINIPDRSLARKTIQKIKKIF